MIYNFEETVLDRQRRSIKWELMLRKKPARNDIIPLTVADMEFENAPEIREAIKHYLDTQILGYTQPNASYYQALTQWFADKHGIHFTADDVVITSGVVFALHSLIAVMTQPNDGVLVMTPVYHPFFAAIKNNDCRVITSSLIETNNEYSIDFEDLKTKMHHPDTTLMILCNPHNPVGRVWTEAELRQIHALAQAYQVRVISDEIHCDITFAPQKHVSYALIDPLAPLCTSASKTFNLATTNTSNIVIKDTVIKDALRQRFTRLGLHQENGLGLIATEAAYSQGEPWLHAVLEVIQANHDLVKARLITTKIKLSPLEGTYLLWLDFRDYSCDSLPVTLEEKGALYLNSGAMFGPEGSGFMRMNLACPTKYIEQAVDRLLTVCSQL